MNIVIHVPAGSNKLEKSVKKVAVPLGNHRMIVFFHGLKSG